MRAETIDVGRRRLSMWIAGAGPAVVFEAGSGCSSLDWVPVRRQLGDDVRTVAYDRAGYGASDPTRYRHPTGRVDDLAAVVDHASPGAPVVLVGHSFGSHLIRLLAARSPHRVVGLVLVDGRAEQLPIRQPMLDERVLAANRRLLAAAALVARLGVLPHVGGLLPVPGRHALDFRIRRARAAMSSSAIAAMRHEAEHVSLTDGLVRDASWPSVPVKVLTHGRPGGHAPGAVSARDAETLEAAWQELQRDMADAAPEGELILAEDCGHFIHLEDPALVARAVQSVLP